MITKQILIENPDIEQFERMLNKESYNFQEWYDYWIYNKLGYNFAWRYINNKIVNFENIIPWSVKILEFIPLNIHLYQNQRVWNIIVFSCSKKNLLGIKEFVYIWYEWKNIILEEFQKDKVSEKEMNSIIKNVCKNANDFNERTSKYISILSKKFWLRIYKSNWTYNDWKFIWYKIDRNKKEISPNVISTKDWFEFSDVLFNLVSKNEITGKENALLYDVYDLKNILI